MAGNDIILNVGANLSPAQRQLQTFVTQAQRQMGSQSFKFTLDEKGFRQPLGRITGDLNQFQGAMDASIARTLAFGASVGAIGGVTKAFKDMVAVTAKVEHSLKEINILLNLSTKDLQGFSKELFGVAKNTASSFDTVTTAATEFSRQGLSAAETAKRVNNALILVRLSGLSAEASVSALTAAVNGFKSEAITTTEVVNRLANVDAKFAVSSADLAKALSRAGAVATDAKVKFNELIAATTAVQQATARGGNVIGNGFKTIFTRLQRSKVRQELEKIGVATTTATGSIRGAIDVLTDYAKVYQTLSDQQKAFTSEQVAGVFQINTLKALIGDLSNEFGVYNQALATANNTTNEAVQRNAQLNDTLQSLASQTGTEIAELAAKIGSISFEGNFKGLLGLLKGILGNVNQGLDSEGAGAQIATGIMKGIGNFLSGPGLAIALIGITRLLGFIGKQTTQAIGQVLAIGSQSQKRQVVQQKINALLLEDNALLQKIFASSGHIGDINKLVTKSIHDQNRALANQKLLVQQIAASFQITKSGNIGPAGGAGPASRGAAGGFVPNLVRGERSSISQGVGGARSGDRPVVIPNFNFGRGAKGTMVAHTGEHIVPNFAGGGSAIFNRNMVSSMGLPRGAKRVAARGFVPNFATDDVVEKIIDVSDGDSLTADVRVQRNIGHRLADVDAVESNQWGHAKAQEILGRKYKNTKKGREYLQKNITSARPGAYGRLLFKDDFKAKELVTAGVGIPDYRYTSTSKYKPQIMEARKAERGIWGRRHKQHPKRLMWEKQNAKILEMERKREEAGLGFSQKALSDTLVGTSEGSRADYLKKKKKGAAGGFIPNFANYKLRSGEKVSGAKLGSMRSSMSPADYDFAKANEVESAFAPAKAKTDPNMADAIYRTNQIVALVSNKMAAKKGTEFATGTKDAVSFSAAGTKSLSGGPVQVENIIAPYVYKAAEVVFQQMTNQMPVGGIKNIPDGLKKMAGSVFEAATQKMVGTTQFKGNQNLDMPVVTGGNKELLDNAFNTKGLTAMNAAEIKLGYNKALMQDVATKIIRSRKVPRGKGGPIDPNNFHAAGGFIPSFANLSAMSNTPAGKRALTTERALAGSSRMGFDSRVGYGVFNNDQGSLGNAVSQHLNSGDSMASLASTGEAAQAAVAAAAMGFLPNFAWGRPKKPPADLKFTGRGPYGQGLSTKDVSASHKALKELNRAYREMATNTNLTSTELKGLKKVMGGNYSKLYKMGVDVEDYSTATEAARDATEKVAKAENKRDKETQKRERGGGRGERGGRGKKGRGGGIGLAQIMGLTFVAEQVSAFASQAAAKDGSFEGQQAAKRISGTTSAVTTGFALGGQIHPILGVITGVAAGLGAFSTSLDKASIAIDSLEYEAEKTAQVNQEGNAALTNYINLLGQLNAETDPAKAKKLENQMADALSQIADETLRKEVSIRATDVGGLRGLESERGSEQRDQLLKQNLDMAKAVEKNVKDGNFYTRELSQYMSGASDADDTGFEKWAKGAGGAMTKFFTREKFWSTGQDVNLEGQQGTIMTGLDKIASKIPFLGKKIAEKTAAEQARVLEIRERVGATIAGTSSYEGNMKALENISYRLAMADEGDMGAVKGLTLGGLYKQMGIDKSQIPAQFLDRIDEDLSTAGDDIEDVLKAIADTLKGQLEFRRGVGREIAYKNAAKAANDLKRRLDDLKISPEEIFGKAVKEGQRRIQRAQATSKFRGNIDSMQRTYIGGMASDVAGDEDKSAAMLRMDKAANKREALVSLGASSLKFQAKIAEELVKENQDEGVKDALHAVREGIIAGQTLDQIIASEQVAAQGAVVELLKDQLAEERAIKKAANRTQHALTLANLLQRAQQAEKIRATTREKIGGGRIVARNDRAQVLRDLGTINRGRGSRGRGTEALLKEGEAYQNIGKRFKGIIPEELQTKIEGGGRKLTTLGNVQDLTRLLAPGIKLGQAPRSTQEAVGRIIPMLEKRLSGYTKVSSKQLLNSRLLLDVMKGVQNGLQKSPEASAFEKYSQKLKYRDVIQPSPNLSKELGVAGLEQQRQGFLRQADEIEDIVKSSKEARAKGGEALEIDNKQKLIASMQAFMPQFQGAEGKEFLEGKTAEQLENALTNFARDDSRKSAELIKTQLGKMAADKGTRGDEKAEFAALIAGQTGALKGVGALGEPGGAIPALAQTIEDLKREIGGGIKLTLEQAIGAPIDRETVGDKDATGATQTKAETEAKKDARFVVLNKDKKFKDREAAFLDVIGKGFWGFFRKQAYKDDKAMLAQGKGSQFAEGVKAGPNAVLELQHANIEQGKFTKAATEAAKKWAAVNPDKFLSRPYSPEDFTKNKNKSRGFLPSAARGALGDSMARERRDIRNGVGGAIPGVDRPTLIPNFNGKPVVAHTGEHLVNNYNGGKSAIFNRDMVGKMGMPAGARRISAAGGSIPNMGGHIPNMATPKALSRTDTEYDPRAGMHGPVQDREKLYPGYERPKWARSDKYDMHAMNDSELEARIIKKAWSQVIDTKLGLGLISPEQAKKLAKNPPGVDQVAIVKNVQAYASEARAFYNPYDDIAVLGGDDLSNPARFIESLRNEFSHMMSDRMGTMWGVEGDEEQHAAFNKKRLDALKKAFNERLTDEQKAEYIRRHGDPNKGWKDENSRYFKRGNVSAGSALEEGLSSMVAYLPKHEGGALEKSMIGDIEASNREKLLKRAEKRQEEYEARRRREAVEERMEREEREREGRGGAKPTTRKSTTPTTPKPTTRKSTTRKSTTPQTRREKAAWNPSKGRPRLGQTTQSVSEYQTQMRRWKTETAEGRKATEKATWNPKKGQPRLGQTTQSVSEYQTQMRRWKTETAEGRRATEKATWNPSKGQPIYGVTTRSVSEYQEQMRLWTNKTEGLSHGYIPNYVGGWGGMSQTWGGLGMIPKKLRKPTMKTIAGKGSGLQTRGRMSMTPESAARMRAQGQALAKKGGAAATKAATGSAAAMGPSWFSTAQAYQNVRLTQNPIHNPMTPVPQRFGRVRGLPGSPRLSGAVHPGSGGPGRIGPVARTAAAQARIRARQEAGKQVAKKAAGKGAARLGAGALRLAGGPATVVGLGIGLQKEADKARMGAPQTPLSDAELAKLRGGPPSKAQIKSNAQAAAHKATIDKLRATQKKLMAKKQDLAKSGADWKTQRKEKSRLNKIKFAEIEKQKELDRQRAEKEAGTDTASIIAASKKHRQSAGAITPAATRRSNLMIGDESRGNVEAMRKARTAKIAAGHQKQMKGDLGTDPYDLHLGKFDWAAQQRAKLGPRSEGQERRMKGHRADSSGMPWLHPDYQGPPTIGPQHSGDAGNVGAAGAAGPSSFDLEAQQTLKKVGLAGNVGAAGAAGPGGATMTPAERAYAQEKASMAGAPTVAQRQGGQISPIRRGQRLMSREEKIARMRANAASMGGGVGRSMARSKAKFGSVVAKSKRRFAAAGPRNFGRRAEGFIPNLSMGEGLGSDGSVANEFLNFAEGRADRGPKGKQAEGMDQTLPPQGPAMKGGDALDSLKSSRQKHNVNVNIEVYGNVSEGAIDGIQSNSSDMATLLEGLVNGGI